MAVLIPEPGSTPADPPPGRARQTSMTAGGGPGGDLAIWTDQSANRCVLRLRGRLCADTVGLVDGHVDRLGCRWCDEVVVDLRSVVVMDEVGARLLVGLSHYVAARGGRFEVQSESAEAAALLAAAEVELGG